jgi:DNA-binding NarL/FixJ family response regulator
MKPDSPAKSSPHPKLVRLALVEDVADMRESWRQLMDSLPGFHCVCACASGQEALRVIPREAPDVIIMDINMPGMNGIECTVHMKRKLPKTPILILTVSADTETVFRALESGADGYLLKRSRPEQLQTAILDVLEGGAPMTSEIARRVVASFRRRAVQRDEVNKLTRREEEVLTFLSKGFSNKEIADKMSLGLETVRGHVKNVYEKLHVHSRAEAVARYFTNSPPTDTVG